MQNLAVPIAVNQATGKATWIGITAMAGLFPSLIANSFAGTIADRFERRAVLFVFQFGMAIAAFALWWLFRSERPSMVILCVLVACSSFLGGVSITTWQSFVPTLVPRELLGPAVRLNSMQFAFGRALGPLLAAVAIGAYGPRIAFLANGVSYVTVLGVLAVMPKTKPAAPSRESAFKQIADGWRYVASYRSLVLPSITNFVTGFLGFAFVQLSAPIAVDLFHRKRTTSGWLNVGFGIGGVVGMVVVSWIGERVPRSKTVPFWLFGWVFGFAAVAFAPNFGLGIAAMVIVGIGHVGSASSLNSSLQLQVDERYRGRVLSVYMWGILAGVPLGSIVFGSMMDHVGARPALLVAASGIGIYALCLRRMGLRYVDSSGPSGPPLRRRRPITG